MAKETIITSPETPRSISPAQSIPLLQAQLEKLRLIASTRPINTQVYTAWKSVIRELLIKSFGSASQNVTDVIHASGSPLLVGASVQELDQRRADKIDQQISTLDGCIEQLKIEVKLQEPEKQPEDPSRTVIMEEIHSHFSKDASLLEAEQFAIDHQDKIEAFDSLQRDGTLEQTGGKLSFSLRSYVESPYWPKDEALLNRLLPILKEMYSEKKGALHEVSELVARLDKQGLHAIYGIDIERALRLFDRVGLLGGHNLTNDGGVPRIKIFGISPLILRPKSIADQVKQHFGSAQTISETMRAAAGLMGTTLGPAASAALPSGQENKKVFIVHGHDGKAREAVAKLVDKLDLEPIILHEKANQGLTLMEKFLKHSDVGFAIILMTADDTGKANSEEDARPRARQNVVFEWGYFVGRLGRDRVCALYEQGIDLPSDLNGIVYIALDTEGHWRFNVLKELKAAGYNVDAKKLLE